MKKTIVLLLCLSMAIIFTACSENKATNENKNDDENCVEAGGIVLDVPKEYLFQDEVSDKHQRIYFKYDEKTGNLPESNIAFYSYDPLSKIHVEDPKELAEDSKNIIEEALASFGAISKIKVTEAKIIEDKYPLLGYEFRCDDGDEKTYFKVYCYCEPNGTVMVHQQNYLDDDFTAIDSMIKNAEYEFEEETTETTTEPTTEPKTEATTEPTTQPTTQVTTRATTQATTKASSGMKKVTNSDLKTHIWVCAQDVARQSLKSPRKAKFCSINEAKIYSLGNKQYMAMGYVDAQNSYGAEMRTDFCVWLTKTKNGYKDGYVEFDE